MSRLIKEKMVEQYATRFRGVDELAVLSTVGIDVQTIVAFRSVLRERGIQAMVVTNRLCKRALTEVGLEPASALLQGPSTLVWGGGGMVDLAKTLVAQAKGLAALQIRGGYMEGRILSKEDIEALSKMPSREELIGMVVARATGQASRVVALMRAPASGLLGQIRELEKRSDAVTQ